MKVSFVLKRLTCISKQKLNCSSVDTSTIKHATITVAFRLYGANVVLIGSSLYGYMNCVRSRGGWEGENFCYGNLQKGG